MCIAVGSRYAQYLACKYIWWDAGGKWFYSEVLLFDPDRNDPVQSENRARARAGRRQVKVHTIATKITEFIEPRNNLHAKTLALVVETGTDQAAPLGQRSPFPTVEEAKNSSK